MQQQLKTLTRKREEVELLLCDLLGHPEEFGCADEEELIEFEEQTRQIAEQLQALARSNKRLKTENKQLWSNVDLLQLQLIQCVTRLPVDKKIDVVVPSKERHVVNQGC